MPPRPPLVSPTIYIKTEAAGENRVAIIYRGESHALQRGEEGRGDADMIRSELVRFDAEGVQ